MAIVDNDNDGWDVDDECDDSNYDVHPGASIPPCDEMSEPQDWNCDGINDQDQCSSPVLVDVAGHGIDLTSRIDGVWFDLDGNGTPERLPWTTVGGDDAWLVLDRNGNGLIDDGTELFGNFTPQPVSGAPNGFLALAVFDDRVNGGNEDGWIDMHDSVYLLLRLWQDANHDGISQPTELVRLASASLQRISLLYRQSNKKDRWGNLFTFRAKVEGVGGPWAYDVFFGSSTAK